jgi:hypothetical protein
MKQLGDAMHQQEYAYGQAQSQFSQFIERGRRHNEVP